MKERGKSRRSSTDSLLSARVAAFPAENKKRLSFPRRFLKKVIVSCGRLATATLSAAAIATSATATAAVASTATAAVATTTTTIAATAAAVAATTAAAPTATWACFTRTRFVHGQGPPFNGLAVELGDGLLRVGFIGHGDKGKTARLAGKFVLHEGDFGDRARLREKVLKVGFGGIEGKISYV